MTFSSKMKAIWSKQSDQDNPFKKRENVWICKMETINYIIIHQCLLIWSIWSGRSVQEEGKTRAVAQLLLILWLEEGDPQVFSFQSSRFSFQCFVFSFQCYVFSSQSSVLRFQFSVHSLQFSKTKHDHKFVGPPKSKAFLACTFFQKCKYFQNMQLFTKVHKISDCI